VATYLAKRGHRTSDDVARTLLAIPPDDYGLSADAPADEAQLDELTAYCERMRAKPANDTALPAHAAPAPAHDVGTSFAAPHLSVQLARVLDDAARAHGWTRTPAAQLRKCQHRPSRSATVWLCGHYTRHDLVVVTLR
jgi:hypothetical protein